ncbi:alpha-L-fucosidase [Streptomyces sp. NPDC006529]|uniref:alpha-L-fucosidase n=1 Tax=Streptomyces sp. NPDC006529 TaxID=3157177 RepID=UPI0033AB4DAE
MSSSLSPRSLTKATAPADGAAPSGLPQAPSPTDGRAYAVPPKLDWWYRARFGMFVHFGSYSHRGHGEWAFCTEDWDKTDYQTRVTAPFAPTSFNAATIAELAKNAGMKYLVITAKHHEGYAMWDSDVAGFTDTTGAKLYNLHDYNGFRPDLLAQLKTECEKRGVTFGLYYSIVDWSHHSQTVNRTTLFSDMSSQDARSAYVTDMKAQLQELLDRYDPAVLWFDGDWCGNPAAPTLTDWWTGADGEDLYDWLTARKPGLVVNERVKRDLGLGDFACPEQTVPARPLDRPRETCATMNGQWGHTDWAENDYRSVQDIVQEMVTVVSRDGNYLLNIGPEGDGAVPAGAAAVLGGLASWMGTHADSIHGTSGSPFAVEPPWGRITKKSGTLFAHVFSRPTDGALRIPAVHNTIGRVHLMNDPSVPLDHTVAGGQITVSMPAAAPNAYGCAVCVEVDGMPAVLAGGVYRLISAQSGKALDNDDTATEGGQVVQRAPDGGPPQQWRVTDAGHGYYTLVCVRSGKALDGYGAGADGTGLVQRADGGGRSQQWAVTAVGEGAFRLTNRHSGKALDNGCASGDGSPVIQRAANGGPAQNWNMTRLG